MQAFLPTFGKKKKICLGRRVFGRFSGDQDLLINSSMPFNSQSGRTTVFVFGSVRPCRKCRFGSGIGARIEAGLLRQ